MTPILKTSSDALSESDLAFSALFIELGNTYIAGSVKRLVPTIVRDRFTSQKIFTPL
jgi:hypothetical protein